MFETVLYWLYGYHFYVRALLQAQLITSGTCDVHVEHLLRWAVITCWHGEHLAYTTVYLLSFVFWLHGIGCYWTVMHDAMFFTQDQPIACILRLQTWNARIITDSDTLWTQSLTMLLIQDYRDMCTCIWNDNTNSALCSQVDYWYMYLFIRNIFDPCTTVFLVPL